MSELDQCEDCGDPLSDSDYIVDQQPDEYHLYCRDCYGYGDATDNKKLRELVKEWRKKAKADTFSSYQNGVTTGQELCADELEAIIEDE
jgi:ribosome-binding protein aMBF1 (putative translation factor)